MNNERDFKGIWIPKEIWCDDRLSALDKFIYAEIDSLDNEQTGCYASNKYLSEFCKCSETKVSNAISKLIKCNLLVVESFDGRQRILKSRLTNFKRQTYKKCKADLQKMKESNIIDNTNELNNINNEIDDFFEKIWGLLKSTPYDRKSKVSKKRKKELYQIGFEKIKKAIDVYLEVQNPKYYHRRDNFFNEVIDKFIGKDIKDFKEQEKKGKQATYNLDEFERMLDED